LSLNPDGTIWRKSNRKGSAAWYKRDDPSKAYFPLVCGNCSADFLGLRGASFCSNSCAQSQPRTEQPTYRSAHSRVTRSRGKASDQTCVDCGGQAAEWSYVGCADEIVEDGWRYCGHPEHYAPRCLRCHRSEDQGTVNLTDAQRRGVRASIGVSNQEIAEHFGVSRALVRKIKKGV